MIAHTAANRKDLVHVVVGGERAIFIDLHEHFLEDIDGPLDARLRVWSLGGDHLQQSRRVLYCPNRLITQVRLQCIHMEIVGRSGPIDPSIRVG